MSGSLSVRVAALAVFSLGLPGCHRTSPVTVATPPIPVTVSHPITRTVGDFEDVTCRTAAVDSVEVRRGSTATWKTSTSKKGRS